MGDWSSGGERFQYPSLTATNYTSWSIRVQAIMEDQGVWEIMEPSGERDAMAVAAARAKDRKAKAHLLQCLPDDLLMQVAGKKTGKEVWDSLKARFVGEERVKEARLQTLKSEFDALKMKTEDSIDQYVGQLTSMSVRYANIGGLLNDTALVKKLFDTVPERFINMVAGIEQFYDLSKLSFADAVGRLKAFEERTKKGSGGSAVKSDTGQVLLTRAEWKARQKRSSGEGSGRNSSGSRGRGRGRGRSNGGRGGEADGAKESLGKRDKSHIKCFKCKNYGHYANRCPGEQQKDEEAHHVKKVELEPTVLMAETVEEPRIQNRLLSDNRETQGEVCLNGMQQESELHYAGDEKPCGDLWYLDNGASNHMTGDRQKFRNIDSTFGGKVCFGDGC